MPIYFCTWTTLLAHPDHTFSLPVVGTHPLDRLGWSVLENCIILVAGWCHGFDFYSQVFSSYKDTMTNARRHTALQQNGRQMSSAFSKFFALLSFYGPKFEVVLQIFVSFGFQQKTQYKFSVVTYSLWASPQGISGDPWPDDRQPTQQVRGVAPLSSLPSPLQSVL